MADETPLSPAPVTQPGDRLSEIRAWRERFSVNPTLEAEMPDREHIYEGQELGGPVAVMPHTRDDYDFMLAEIDRLREVIKAAAQVCRSADKMNSLGPIQALAIALDREVPNG